MFSVVLGSCLAAAALTNAGFDGGAKGWVLPRYSWRVETNGGRDVSAGAVRENRDPKYFSYAKQDVASEPGVSYEFSGWVKVEDGKPSPHVVLGWCDTSNKWISCESATAVPENDPQLNGLVRHEGRTPPRRSIRWRRSWRFAG